MGKYLIYYTIGYSDLYKDCIDLSIKSLKHFTKGRESEYDIIILCDNSFHSSLKKMFPSIKIINSYDSKTPEIASMRKLDIFDYDIQSYDKVLFIDSDILIHSNILDYIKRIDKDDILYVCTEHKDQKQHTCLYYSLVNYTREQFEYLSNNDIHVFNAGLFGFVPSNRMKIHFDNIRNNIRNHIGKFFYEQSFMNVYFNLCNKTDRNLFTRENYILGPVYKEYKDSLLHFCGSPGNGTVKYNAMLKYSKEFMPYLFL
jgi:lipopolysaccharide biosynthesis glycosyltransferase